MLEGEREEEKIHSRYRESFSDPRGKSAVDGIVTLAAVVVRGKKFSHSDRDKRDGLRHSCLPDYLVYP